MGENKKNTVVVPQPPTPKELQARKDAEVKAAEEQARKAAEDPQWAEAQELLAAYPGQDVIYMTSDNFGYFHEKDAQNHAAQLRNKEVRLVTRTGDGKK